MSAWLNPVRRITMAAVLVAAGTTLIILTAFSQPVLASPTPRLNIRKTSAKIDLDGKVDTAEWHAASKVSSFIERYPGDNTQPAVKTEAYLTFDDKNLYVAFVCHDDPAAIRATLAQRDQFSGDDGVGLYIDTYGDATWAYMLIVNPYGVQKDYLWSNVAGEDIGFDLIWESSAIIDSEGYEVEIAVPFSSMRFPNTDVQSWRVDLRRFRPRESSFEYAWSDYDRNVACAPCQWGTVSGVSNVHPGKGLEILPTYLAYQSSELRDAGNPTSGLHNGDVNGELSVGGKYALSSDVVADATYNPDFSQIEADAAQVDVNSTIALLYPERRPFFQEGQDVFRTLFNSFYTRTVNDPLYAVKMIGRKPGYTFGFMSAQDDNTVYLLPLEESSALFLAGKSYVNAFRATRPVGKSSQLGMIFTDRRLDGGGYGTILAADGDIRLTSTIAVDGQYIYSFTGEPDKAGASAVMGETTIDEGRHTAVFDGESYHGHALISRVKRFARHWSFMIDFDEVEPAYRTLTGYDPWVNYRNASLWTQYTFYPKNSIFERIQPQIYTEGRWLFDGSRRWEHQNFQLNGNLNWAQTWVSLQGSRGSENWTSSYSGNRIDYNDLYSYGFETNSNPSDQMGLYIQARHANEVARFADAIGSQNSVSISVGFKPIDRLVIEPDINWVRSTHVDTKQQLFRQFIARTRLRFQANRQLSARLVVQYVDWNQARIVSQTTSGTTYSVISGKAWDIDPLITYRLSPFSVLYIGSTHDISYFPPGDTYDSQWRLSSRQFFIKLQYLFRV